MVVTSKVGFPAPGVAIGLTPDNIRRSLIGTLDRLGFDYLDLYQLHCFDPTVPDAETLGALDALVEEGLVRCAFAWQMAHFDAVVERSGTRRLVPAQVMYNQIRRDNEREHVADAAETGTALLGYGPLHGGQLAGGWRSREEIPRHSRAAANPGHVPERRDPGLRGG